MAGEELERVRAEALEAVAQAADLAALEQVRVAWLGKKGRISGLMRRMASLAPEERPAYGKAVNELKGEVGARLAERRAALERQELERRLAAERLDVTLPGRPPRLGSLHPLTQTRREIEQIFQRMGFTVESGPEVESEYYNFEALNLPPDHPARDMQDTFYLGPGRVLRTHTSSVQGRVMARRKPPIKVIAPGRVFRRDSDHTHSPMFHQVEGLLVDRRVSFGDLKGILQAFTDQIFGRSLPLRFRPSYFPFTEPSAEVDVRCVMCDGAGCRVCGHTGWLEILGCGMVDPNVFELAGYDPEAVSGLAFGMGIERICMLKHAIPDLRLFFENDLRFLEQF
ncbi:MAG: phenylalanine--tRNA ligase subunit alpha [Nitrospirae bacterium]|nr:MAG: phenylalanine--tRNA ligase subunit alpha [Nitrospirota bacterium]